MAYDDGFVACTDDALVIRWYYPFGAKRIPYGDIAEVRRRRMTLLTGKWRIWGTTDFTHWLNFDPGRLTKSEALYVQLTGKGVVPVITPKDMDAVAAELASHGVSVSVD
jgi:hypothetical protein